MTMTIDAIGKRVIVEVLDENEVRDSGLIRANTPGARCKGRIISAGSKAKEEEPKLEPGVMVLYYKQPSFEFQGKTISEFDYAHLIAILND